VPFYTDIPTKTQWKRDLGLATVFGNYKSPFPAMERLGRLIAAYHEVPGNGYTKQLNQLYLIHLMYRQCEYVIRNNGKGSTYSKAKMGGHLSDKQLEAVGGLHLYLAKYLEEFLECHRPELNFRLAESFGRDVTDHARAEDARIVALGGMDWYQSDAARQVYKLSFRNGLACKWDYMGGGKGNLGLYDTDAFGDALEYHGSLFVLDRRGRIYTSGQAQMDLKHSSFMAGEATQCAGTMRVEQGKVVWVSGKSGHYQPTVMQMVNLLERLSSYQVDLKNVTVYRENYTQIFTGGPTAHFEGCEATVLLVQRAWPTGVQPTSMRIHGAYA